VPAASELRGVLPFAVALPLHRLILTIRRGEAITMPDDENHVVPVRMFIARLGISFNAPLPETKQLDETPVNPAG